jgi:hypothetical protein
MAAVTGVSGITTGPRATSSLARAAAEQATRRARHHHHTDHAAVVDHRPRMMNADRISPAEHRAPALRLLGALPQHGARPAGQRRTHLWQAAIVEPQIVTTQHDRSVRIQQAGCGERHRPGVARDREQRPGDPGRMGVRRDVPRFQGLGRQYGHRPQIDRRRFRRQRARRAIGRPVPPCRLVRGREHDRLRDQFRFGLLDDGILIDAQEQGRDAGQCRHEQQCPEQDRVQAERRPMRLGDALQRRNQPQLPIR